MTQEILMARDAYNELDNYLVKNKIKKLFLVCGNSFGFMEINNYFSKLEKRLGIEMIYFSEFQPNPLYEFVVAGVKSFNNEKCDAIMAVGGGSAIDVAKCIKLYANMDSSLNYLEQKIVPNDIKLLAVPTTSGSGSEATKYAVIYYQGEKQSIADDSCIPSVVCLDPNVLQTVPIYHKKSTMMDALCHAIESFWSVNSTEESKKYSSKAIKLVLDNKDSYLANEDSGNANMLKAANMAGKAINVTQTTAGHAMSYKLTSLYGIAHGHAVAVCLARLWPYMLKYKDKCIDPRGKEYLEAIFKEVDATVKNGKTGSGIENFQTLVRDLGLEAPVTKSESDYEVLVESVNATRLKNNPVELDEKAIDLLYRQIVRTEGV